MQETELPIREILELVDSGLITEKPVKTLSLTVIVICPFCFNGMRIYPFVLDSQSGYYFECVNRWCRFRWAVKFNWTNVLP